MSRAWALATALALAGVPAAAAGGGELSALPGWEAAAHGAALSTWARHCAVRAGPCPDPSDQAHPRAFWERHFRVRALPEGGAALITGYYEPVLAAAAERHADQQVPLYAMPEAARDRQRTRAEIMDGALAGRVPVIAWLADPVEAFFLHVQGSGRLRLADGRWMRVGFAGRNAHPYRSIGRIAAARGLVPGEGLTASRLKAWLRANPGAGDALMRENPSYIFFREIEGLAPGQGPVGAAGRPLVPRVSAALDPAHYPAGTPLWLETPGSSDARGHLVIAEDTGAAITGPARADLFMGTGPTAGRAAGALVARGRIHAIVPHVQEGAEQ